MRRPLLALAVAAALAAPAAFAQGACSADGAWPTTAWPQAPVDRVAKAAALKDLEDYAFTLVGEDRERRGYRTDALLIIKGGAIIYERYGRGYDETKRHLSWSVAKSFTSALVGIAVKEGALTLDQSICDTITEYAGTDRCAITVKDTITFGTGLAWQESYEGSTYQVSSVLAMFFGEGRRNQLEHILGHGFAAEPGKRWSYSTGDAQLAALVARRALERAHGQDAFWEVLFGPLGMESAVLEEDLEGMPQGGSHLYATPRDFAKFGYLFLRRGCWAGQQLLDGAWVYASTQPSAAFRDHSLLTDDDPAGYAWWLNVPVPPKKNPWPDVPQDAFAALGHWGQRIIVVPSQDLVIVRTGDDREGSLPVNELTKRCLAVAR